MKTGDFLRVSPALQTAVRNALGGMRPPQKPESKKPGENTFSEYEAFSIDTGEVLVKLQTENATLEKFAAMAIISSAIEATDEDFQYSPPSFYIGPVTESNKDNPFVICEEIPDTDGFTRAILSGVTVAKVTISDSSHKYAKPSTTVDGELVSSATGTAKILWKAGTSGEQWCILQLGAVGESSASSSVIPAKIFSGTSQSGYLVYLHENGINQSSTGTVTVFLPETSIGCELDSGTWILVFPSTSIVIGGSDT